MNSDLNCVFCRISDGNEPARYRYLDDDLMVIINKLTWVPLMLLVMPREHMSQIQLLSSDLMVRMGILAVDMGAMYTPNGFRVLSKFGKDGMQSQAHGHIHVIGGTSLGPYA